MRDIRAFLERFDELAGNNGDPWGQDEDGSTLRFSRGEVVVAGQPDLWFGNCYLRELFCSIPQLVPELAERAIQAEGMCKLLLSGLEDALSTIGEKSGEADWEMAQVYRLRAVLERAKEAMQE